MTTIDELDIALQELTELCSPNSLSTLLSLDHDNSAIKKFKNSVVSAVKDGSDLDELIKLLQNKYPDDAFWGEIRVQIDEALLPFNETAFLRAMPTNRLMKYFETAFENMVLYQESSDYLQKVLSVDPANLKITMRVYNTLISWVICGRMSKRRFLLTCKGLFRFTDQISEKLWTLLDNNRDMLIRRFLIKSMEELIKLKTQIIEFFEDDES